jgi:hypothetical protein
MVANISESLEHWGSWFDSAYAPWVHNRPFAPACSAYRSGPCNYGRTGELNRRDGHFQVLSKPAVAKTVWSTGRVTLGQSRSAGVRGTGFGGLPFSKLVFFSNGAEWVFVATPTTATRDSRVVLLVNRVRIFIAFLSRFLFQDGRRSKSCKEICGRKTPQRFVNGASVWFWPTIRRC